MTSTGVKFDCIAVDWVGRNLYWIDGIGGGRIIAIGLNSTITSTLDFTVILDKDFEQPLSLALLPQKGQVYFVVVTDEQHPNKHSSAFIFVWRRVILTELIHSAKQSWCPIVGSCYLMICCVFRIPFQ